MSVSRNFPRKIPRFNKNKARLDSKRKWPQKGSQKTWRFPRPNPSLSPQQRYAKSRKSTKVHQVHQDYHGVGPQPFPLKGWFTRKNPVDMRSLSKNSLVSVSPDFLLVHFAGCLKGNTGHSWYRAKKKKARVPRMRLFC